MYAIPNCFNKMMDVSVILMLNQFYIFLTDALGVGSYLDLWPLDGDDVTLCAHNLKDWGCV